MVVTTQALIRLAHVTLTTTHHSHRKLNNNNKRARPFSFSCELSTPTNVSPVAIASTSNGYPKYDRLLPCPSYSLPPRVEHLVVTQEGLALDFICKTLNLPPLFVEDLIRFGAVHYALLPPEPPKTADPEQVKAYKEATKPLALRRRANSIRGMTIREAQKTFRVADKRHSVEAGAFLRVHVHPKRYPRCYEIYWKSRILAVTKSFVVLDKPAGTSVGGSIDNIEENCATFAARALGLSPLRTTHQIDNCTEGCVVLARTKQFASIFNEKIREKTVKKQYVALVVAPVPIGTITHYMRPSTKAPRLVSEDFIEGWQICQLEIIECTKIPWPSVEKKYCGDDKDSHWPRKDFVYECRIDLLTGRTHQIRAQLAALGAPIVGDSAYMPAALEEKTRPGTNPFGKYKKHDYYYSSDDQNEQQLNVVEDWISKHGKEPGYGIGLQACRISWDSGKYAVEAGTPWWRR